MNNICRERVGGRALGSIRFEGALLAVSFVLVFVPTFSWMWGRFTASGSFYSHGFIIPPLALFLAWYRNRGRRLVAEPWSPGLAVVVAGLLCHILSLLFGIHFVSGIAMIVVIAGMLLYLFGIQVTVRSGPALALFLLMVPMPRVFLIDAAFLMQLASARLTAAGLRLLDPGVAQEGVYLTLNGNRIFEVAYPCSGLRSLLVFVATAWIIIAIPARIRPLRSALFLLLSFPVAVASNAVRLSATAVAAIRFGHADTVHTICGIAAFVVYSVIMASIGKRVLWKED